MKDVQLKAARTRPVGCQLAWVVDQMPDNGPLGMIGYSYGARIVTGALHILGGGSLSGIGLSERAHPHRAPVRVVLIAAAMHSHWLGPGQYHGKAMSQIERMLFINNCIDPMMQWYHLSVPNGDPQAMGLAGPTFVRADHVKLCNKDVSRCVGSKHDERRYLSSPGMGQLLWEWAVGITEHDAEGMELGARSMEHGAIARE
jgi:hypothetical protein